MIPSQLLTLPFVLVCISYSPIIPYNSIKSRKGVTPSLTKATMPNNRQPLGGKIKPCHITAKINLTISTSKATERELSNPTQVWHHNISELDFTPIGVSHLKCPEIRTNHFYFIIQLWNNPHPQPITPRSLWMKPQRLLLIYYNFCFSGIPRSLCNRK